MLRDTRQRGTFDEQRHVPRRQDILCLLLDIHDGIGTLTFEGDGRRIIGELLPSVLLLRNERDLLCCRFLEGTMD